MASEIITNQDQNPRITWEGCSVLLDINDGDRLVFARLSSASTLKIGDKKCSLNPLIGCPFGSMFQVQNGPKGPNLARILPSTTIQDEEEEIMIQSKDEFKDNRALVDDNTAQTLSGQDIDTMRRQGATGDQIVEALIANSSTYGNKTVFSQEKYRLKKQKKYAPRVLLRRPFARSISEAYFKKYPARIGFLRMDVLSLLLSMANITASSDVLVMDMVGGILTGAVAERLGGTGYVCNTYFGANPYQMDIVRIFNFSNEISSRIVRVPLSGLSLAQTRQTQENAPSSEIQTSTDDAIMSTGCDSATDPIPMSEEQVIQQEETPLESVSNGQTPPLSQNDIPVPGNDASALKPCKLRKPGEKVSPEVIKSWKEKGFSSLIIAAPELDTWTIVQELLPLLSYSAPFAIYHQYLQPLTTCMHNLQTAKMAIGLQISEPWLREYQVLPSRTHPFMQMSGFGGYILSGTRICNGEVSIKTVTS